MRSHLVLVSTLALLVTACGSSPSSEEPQGPGNTSGATDEPIVIDPPAESAGRIVEGTDACTTDEDCVPAGCCHAAACVARANAPSCGDAMCTMECRAGTMDCGGGCLCQNGHCAARLWEGSAPELSPQ